MDMALIGIPTPVALASVAVIGYFVGRRLRQRDGQLQRGSARRELKRARAVVKQLDSIGRDVRRNLATHHASVVRFKQRIALMSKDHGDADSLEDLCQEAELVWGRRLELASQIAHAYDDIRQQTNLLMTFSEPRTDSLTGLSNRRALDESLRTMFSMMSRYNTNFSVVMLHVEKF